MIPVVSTEGSPVSPETYIICSKMSERALKQEVGSEEDVAEADSGNQLAPTGHRHARAEAGGRIYALYGRPPASSMQRMTPRCHQQPEDGWLPPNRVTGEMGCLPG